jgi:cytochrome c-type biogenesis protein
MFVLGFSIMFILLGSTLGYLGSLIPNFQTWVNRVGGVIIIVLALQMLGLIHLPLISQSLQVRSITTQRSGLLSSVLMGASFGVSWTPCTGPILAGILALSASTASMAQAALLMTAFSVGLAIPFLVTGFFTAAVSKFLRAAPKLIGAVHLIAGVLLLAMGVLVFTGRVQWLIGTVIQ